jgi:CheY-like chemotaxis protein
LIFQPVHPPGPSFASKNGIRCILSVDDEPGILLTRQAILEKEGYKVLSAVDGEQALGFFAVQAVDLVLLDYLMPRMDGGAVAQEMKKRKPLVPVIMVSGSSVPEDTLTCVDCFVRKGEGPALLLEKIERLLAMFSTRQSLEPETTWGALPQRTGSDG